jgi:PAS domain S-box-containing protein
MTREDERIDSILESIQKSDISLASTISLCLSVQSPCCLFIGEKLEIIYNDAFQDFFKINQNYLGTSVYTHDHQNKKLIPHIEYVVKNHASISLPGNHVDLFQYSNINVQVSLTPIFDGSTIKGCVMFLKDSVDLTNNISTLREEHRYSLDKIFSQSPIGLCVLKGDDFNIEVINNYSLQMMGKHLKEVYHKKIFEVLPELKDQGYEDLFLMVYQSGKKIILSDRTFYILRPNKSIQFTAKVIIEPIIENDNQITGLMILVDDISNQMSIRKRFEDNESRLQMAILATGVGTWEYHVGKRELICSEECKRIFNLHKKEHVTLTDLFAHIHPADKIQVARTFRQVAKPDSTGVFDITFQISTHLKKKARWVRMEGFSTFNKETRKVQNFSGTLIDVSHQQMLGETIHLSELRYRLAVEASGIGTFEWDIETNKIVCSPRLLEIVGLPHLTNYTHEDVLKTLNPDDEVIRKNAIEKSFKTGKLAYDARVIWSDQSVHWIRVFGRMLFDHKKNPQYLYGTMMDVTEEKNRSHKLERTIQERTKIINEKTQELYFNEEQYSRFIREIKDYSLIKLDPQGIIQNWNHGVESIRGYKAEEIVGKPYAMFFPQEERKKSTPEQLLKNAEANGQAFHEGFSLRKNGTFFWGFTTISAIYNADGSLNGFVKVTRDLTDKKTSEDTIKKYAQELESQNRELEQFAYIASHDLQEPLRKIQSFTQMIQKNIDDKEFVLRYFEKVNHSANRMENLIKSVLSLITLSEEVNPNKVVDLTKILEHVLIDYELKIEELKAKIMYDALPTIKGIDHQLTQLFSNLIGNALKFNERQPHIHIQSKIIQRNQIENRPEFLAMGNYWEITFTDNGIGFESQYQEQIFGMFQRLHGRHTYAGTGIGLALCRKIVENHKGYISAKSQLGIGTTFCIYLPAQL